MTAPSTTLPPAHLRQSVKTYVSTHFEVMTCSVPACIPRPDLTADTAAIWEVQVNWKAPRTMGQMIVFVKAEGDQLRITHTDGYTPKRIFVLVPSTNRGRYALDDSQTGRDLTCGDRCFIWVGNQWIHGRIEHSGPSDLEGTYTLTHGGADGIGYYFIATGGGICGLCAGMRVRF